MTPHQGIELMRQGKHTVKIRHGQKLLLTSFYPFDFSKRLALGAVAVAARVVPHLLNATVVTPRHVTTEQGGAASFNVAHDAQLATRQMMGLPVDFAMRAKDIRDFDPLPCPVPDVGSGTHGLWLLILILIRLVAQAVKRRSGIPHMVSR
jgi:hypothetical protein